MPQEPRAATSWIPTSAGRAAASRPARGRRAGRRPILVTDDGRVVATLQLTVIPALGRGGLDRGQVEAVRVAPDLRGQGLGEALLRWAADRATERGCGLLQLKSDRRRNAARGCH